MDRYSRQVRFTPIGPEGQQRLRAAHVLVVGCGALGTHAADALARAGIGRLTLVDRDIVEWSNLQRQVLFTEEDARSGLPKAIAAAARLRACNSDVTIDAHAADCSRSFLDHLPTAPDLVLDGTDNFATRYLLNDWCQQRRVPWIYAGAVGSEGASMVVRPGGPCLRCLWPEPPAATDVGNCETAGILSPAIAAVTAFQTAEAIKLLTGGEPTAGVFSCDVWRGHYGVLPVAAAPAADCPSCQTGAYPALHADPAPAATLCGRDAVQVEPPRAQSLDFAALAQKLAAAAHDVACTEHLVRFTADGVRFTVFQDGRALLFGVRDPLRAKALYDRWLGFA